MHSANLTRANCRCLKLLRYLYIHLNYRLFIYFKISLRDISMQELIEKLKTEVGLTDEQAKKSIETIKGFVVEKFPMLEGAVNSVFGGE
jgi:hypothetical protein